MGEIRPRDVARIRDTQVRPPKWKRLICISVRPPRFLRINSDSHWEPHLRLRQAECNFLDYDSYVELRQLVRVGPDEFREAIARPDNPIGRLTDEVARRIAFEAQRASTLSDENRRIVREGLVGEEDHNPGD
jgi:hypothetical protein